VDDRLQQVYTELNNAKHLSLTRQREQEKIAAQEHRSKDLDAAKRARERLTLDWTTRLAEKDVAHACQLGTTIAAFEKRLAGYEMDAVTSRRRFQEEIQAVQESHNATLAALTASREAEKTQMTSQYDARECEWTATCAHQAREIETLTQTCQTHEATILQLKLATSESTIQANVRHEVEGAWRAKVQALEHALAQGVAKLHAEHERFELALHYERDQRAHLTQRVTALTTELETANLCLAERKRQREIESGAFEDRERRAALAIAQLTNEVSFLRSRCDEKSKHKQHQNHAVSETERIQRFMVAHDEMVKEVATVKRNLDQSLQERALMEARLASVTEEHDKAEFLMNELQRKAAEEVAQANSKVHELEARLVELQRKHDQTHAQNQSLSKERDSLKSERAQLEAM
jgi:hypothetical protein